MKKIFIYRLENSQGNGPYNEHDSTGTQTNRSYILSQSHGGKKDTHPNWNIDGIYDKIYNKILKNPLSPGYSHYYSAFKSLEDLYIWFAGHLDRLLKSGYTIKSYIVDKDKIIMGKSNKQLAFIK